jgi:flavin-dependent dehydrogenase
MTIDCTGRDAFASSRNGWKIRDPYLNKIAVWTYYEGAMRDPGVDEGATMVAYVPEKGWFWYIPLARNIVSCGVVAEKDYLYSDGKDLEKIFHREGRPQQVDRRSPCRRQADRAVSCHSRVFLSIAALLE